MRNDVDIFSNDRKPTTVMRPHSARQATVADKVGGIFGSRIMGAAPVRVQPQPPKAGAFKIRKDLMKGTSLLKRFYDRGDLPICVRHCPSENEIAWKVPVDKLDYRERQTPPSPPSPLTSLSLILFSSSFLSFPSFYSPIHL